MTVLEHAATPGGATSSGEVTLPGFVHDHCAAFAPMAVISPAMRELELDVEWVDPPVVMAHPFDDGTALALHRDPAATAASLGPAGAGWTAAMERMLPQADRLAAAILAPLPPGGDALRLALGLRGATPRWGLRFLRSVQALGLELFGGDTRAAAWLAASAQHAGLPPTTAGSAAFGFLLQLVGQRVGWPFPRTGMQALTDALAQRAAAHGAQRALRRLGRAGPRARRPREPASASPAARSSPPTLSSPRSARACSRRCCPPARSPGGCSGGSHAGGTGRRAFKVDYALSGPVPWAAAEPRSAGVVHVAGELHELAGAAAAGWRGEVPERPGAGRRPAVAA